MSKTHSISYPQLKQEYEDLFNSCVINNSRLAEVNVDLNKIVKNQDRYKAVTAVTNVPWYFIGIVHYLEATFSFTTHLHNGDPLSARTVHVPAGRPVAGTPPFSWEASAKDALTYDGLTTWTSWDIGGMLYCFERFNGFGYRQHGINSPYLWSFSNQYTKGKYTSDGHYNSEAVSQQCGAAVLLKRLIDKQIISIPTIINEPVDNLIHAPGKQVFRVTTPFMSSLVVGKIQSALLSAGFDPMGIDNVYGNNTAEAVAAFQEANNLVADGEVGEMTAAALHIQL